MPGEIYVNPSVMKDKRDAMAVVVDEALRIFMEDAKFEPKFDITPEQEGFFAGTAYAEGEGTSAEKGGNVLDPDSWGGSSGKATMRAETRAETMRKERAALPVLQDLTVTPREALGVGVPETGGLAGSVVNAVGVLTTLGMAPAAASGSRLGGVSRALGASSGTPKLQRTNSLVVTPEALRKSVASEESALFNPSNAGRLSELSKREWHRLGGEVTQAAIKKLGVKYDLSEAHKQGEALYSDIGAYAGESTAGFDAVSKAIGTAVKQRRAIAKGGLNPNVNEGGQFILSAYTAKPSVLAKDRPGKGNSRLRYTINPVSRENIVSAYNTDANTGSVRAGASKTGAVALLEEGLSGSKPVEYFNEAPQVKAPVAGLGGTGLLQPSISQAIKNKVGYNEIVVRPQIGDFYIEDTTPSAGPLPPRLLNQMKRLEQAYKVAHGGSLDPFAAPAATLPNSFNPGL